MIRLQHISLDGWRRLAAFEADLEPASIIVGPTGAGKSSLRAAIEWALTGRVAGWTDERGSGADALIQSGCKKAVVTLTLEDIGTVRRTVYASSTPTRLEVEGIAGSLEVAQAALYERMGVQPAALSVALAVGRFFDLPPARQRDLALRVLQADTTGADVRAALGTEEARAAFDALAVGTLTGTADVVWAEVEKRATERRRDSKRDLEEARRSTGAPQPTSSVDPSRRPEAESLLAALRSERDGMQQAIGAVSEAERSRGTLADRRRRLREERAETEAAAAKKPPRSAADTEALLAERRRELLHAETAAAVAQTEEAGRRAAQVRLASAATPDDSRPGCCPWAPMEFACSVDVTGETAAHILDGARRDAVDALNEAIQARDDTARKLSVLRERVAGLEGDLQRARDFEAKAAAAGERLARIDADLAALDGEEEGLQTRIEQAGSVRASLASLEERISRGEALLRRMDEVARENEASTRAAQKRAALQAEVDALEALCLEFRPGGAKDDMIGDLLAPLADRVAESAEWLAAPRVRIGVGPDGFEVRCAPESDVWLPPSLLSTGESLLVSVAVADGLCRLAGVPLLVVDNANSLDPMRRSRLVAWMLEAREDYGSILILATRGAEPPTDPGMAGLGVYLLHGGVLERAPGVSAVQPPVGAAG